MARKKRSKKDSLEGKVLIAKVGKETEFLKAFQEMVDVAHGELGWKGQAETYYNLGPEIYTTFGVEVIDGEKKNKTLKRIQEMLQQSFLQNVYLYGEWLPKEEAEKRQKSTEVLYGEPEVPTVR